MPKIRTLLAALVVLIFGAISVQAHVALTYPTGGQTFMVGDNVDITWMVEIDHGDCDWDLYFSTDNGANWSVIVQNLPKTTLDYNWTVPNSPTAQGIVRVVQDNYSQPGYDSWSGALTVNAIDSVPSGSVWSWAALVVILGAGAVLVLRQRKVPARA